MRTPTPGASDPGHPPLPPPHDARHEAWLESLVCGDLSAEDPAVAGQLAGCEECARTAAALQDITALLGADASAERAALAAAESQFADPSGTDSTDRTTNTRRSPRRSLRAAVAIAAALVLGVTTRTFVCQSQRSTPAIQLIGSPLQLLAPFDDDASFDGFRWSGPLPPGGTYELRVWAASQTADETALLRVPDLEGSEYHPTPDQRKILPPRIRWMVLAWSVDREPIASSARIEARVN